MSRRLFPAHLGETAPIGRGLRGIAATRRSNEKVLATRHIGGFPLPGGTVAMTEDMSADHALSLAAVYQGWGGFQRNLLNAIAPLSPAQLALAVAPTHWPIGMVV